MSRLGFMSIFALDLDLMKVSCVTGGAPFVLAYSCSKAGLLVLTKNNAQELRSSGIRVNAINVGWMLTDAEDAGQTAEKGEGWLEEADAASPTGRTPGGALGSV